MKKRNERRKQPDELRREYDLSKLKGAVHAPSAASQTLSSGDQSRAIVTGRG
jgi:hypothetical protein